MVKSISENAQTTYLLKLTTLSRRALIMVDKADNRGPDLTNVEIQRIDLHVCFKDRLHGFLETDLVYAAEGNVRYNDEA